MDLFSADNLRLYIGYHHIFQAVFFCIFSVLLVLASLRFNGMTIATAALFVSLFVSSLWSVGLLFNVYPNQEIALILRTFGVTLLTLSIVYFTLVFIAEKLREYKK
jgi:hypothetical protein